MIAPTIANAQHYIKIRDQNVPINLAPSGIKCISCDQVYAPQQFQRHLATHVNPQYIKSAPVYNTSSPKKLNLAAMLDEPVRTQQIWVTSFLPAELPQPEKQKKRVAKPTGQYKLMKTGQIFAGINNFNPDGKRGDISSNIQTQEQAVQMIPEQAIRKNIKLAKVSNQIQKKQIKVYMNNNKVPANRDEYTSIQKQIKDQETQESDGYKVMEAPSELPSQRQGPAQLLKGALQRPDRQNRQTYNISSSLKNPGHSLRISTLSIPSPQFAEQQDKSEKINLGQSRSTVVGGISRYQPSQAHDEHNHQCPCCKGFYCSYCKSSVPPIYRPVPDKDGNYHFHPQQNQRAIEFYQDHYYPRDNQVCTHCQKQMVLGRIIEERQ